MKIFSLKVSSLREDDYYLGITTLCQNTHFIFKILKFKAVHIEIEIYQIFLLQHVDVQIYLSILSLFFNSIRY